MRFDPKDPQQPGQRSLRAVEGARGADSVRRVGRGRRVRSRRAAEAAPDRIRSRRPSDAAAAVRRRRDRLARPGHLRRDRQRAERAPHRVRLPHVRAARRRRDRPKARSGKPPTSRRADGLDNLCGITDVNALGQSRPTMWQHDMEQFARRWRAFGWHAIVIDGHDMNAILDALAEARRTKGRPTMILARTIKGKGVSFVEGKDGWHGKAFKKGEELDRALAELEKQFVPCRRAAVDLARADSRSRAAVRRRPRRAEARRAARLQARRRGRDARGVRHRARQARRGRPARRRARRRREELDVQRQVREGVARSLLPELHRRAGDGRRGDGPGGARRDSVSVDVRLLPDARRRLHPHGGDQQRQHQAGRLARRRVDRRGRAVADGARGSGDVPRRAELHRALSVRRGQHRAAGRAGGLSPRPGLHAHEPAEDAGHLLERRDVHDRRAEGAARERATTSRRSSAPA